MKKVLLIVLLISSFCFPSAGQMFVIDEQGKVYDGSGDDLCKEFFRYRVINGRYPNDKNELLDFMLDKDRAEGVDSIYLSYFNEQNRWFSKLIKKRRNKLTVSGDTCTFYIAKDRYSIRCVGGIAELQKYDSDQFRFWTGSYFYDKDGKYLWSLGGESPSLPLAINNLKKRFGYIVTMEPRFDYKSPLLSSYV